MVPILQLRRHSTGGIQVKTPDGWVENVRDDVVRRALGDEGMNWLLTTHVDETGFEINAIEYQEFLIYKVQD